MSPWLRLPVIYGVYLAAAMSPGPSVLFVLRTAMASRRRGLRAAWGIASGTTIWVVTVTLGMAAVAAGSTALFSIFRAVGGAYFVYLGARYALDALRAGAAGPAKAAESSSSDFAQGLATNLTNPGTIAFFLGLLSLYIDAASPPALRAAVCIGIAMLSCAWYSSLAWLFSTRRMLSVYERIRRPLDAALGLVFVLLGADLLFALARR